MSMSSGSLDPFLPKPLSVTVKRACEITGLGNTTIYELIKNGRLETLNVGRRTLVKYGSLEELVA
jgi:excisionase family DNA binding protein